MAGNDMLRKGWRDMAKGSQFDDMEASGLPVYGVFIRIKGPGPGPDGGCQ